MTKRRAYDLYLTEEQWSLLRDTYPNDPAIQREICRSSSFSLRQPKNPTGKTPSGVRVYQEMYGWNASGYTLVHWDDAKVTSWCLDNGYAATWPKSELPIIWDEDPEANDYEERYHEIKDLIWEREFISRGEIDAWDAISDNQLPSRPLTP